VVTSEDIRAYHHRKNSVRLGGILFGLTYAALWCLIAPAWTGRLAAMLDNHWLILFVTGAAIFFLQELLFLPASYYSGYVLEHRYHLSNESLKAWSVREVKELVLGLVLGAVLLGGLYGLLWYGGRAWWVWVWAGWVLLSVGLTQLFPVMILPLFYTSTPIEDSGLTERLRSMAEGAGLHISGVYKLDLSAQTKKPNAMLTGLGSTRRVLLSDTLLDAFAPGEIETVFAHELGHHRRGHIWKGIALSALSATLVIAGIAWRIGPHRTLSSQEWTAAVAALPQVLLIVVISSLVLRPILNAVLRGFETQCDRDALCATGRETYRAAFQRLADMSLADPKPSRLTEIFFYDHPPIARRLAMADEGVPPVQS